ncbi:mannose-1-phosphate guanylyltransferase [Idiomarina tyrosinivorans]|uniref:Mannose-1-phosphate guanylyltransferase n=1 Tax=Idiomarina tyrosinivorans TaxID=1445662 RepID=A0A432ZS50_9GAMM|nr:nucleotidyltransferase family protein [Idiomarina tyrosinivorans]RUO80692.1 mannose-1-phosphate guanylyltransferase [Idiomarina tyrosinivorans]
MKAMILAAGRGQRMRPLTDSCPKPMLTVNGKPLLVYHLEKLRDLGVTEVVVNTAHLPEKIHQGLGDGSQWQLQIHYSDEPEGGLETAGGIINALPLLGDDPFWLINGDVWTDYPFHLLPTTLQGSDKAHLVMVDNQPHHPNGDFALQDGRLREAEPRLTYAGIGLFDARAFCGQAVAKKPLRPFFQQAIANDQLAGSYWHGQWTDVGTPERLQQLAQQLQRQD